MHTHVRIKHNKWQHDTREGAPLYYQKYIDHKGTSNLNNKGMTILLLLDCLNTCLIRWCPNICKALIILNNSKKWYLSWILCRTWSSIDTFPCPIMITLFDLFWKRLSLITYTNMDNHYTNRIFPWCMENNLYLSIMICFKHFILRVIININQSCIIFLSLINK